MSDYKTEPFKSWEELYLWCVGRGRVFYYDGVWEPGPDGSYKLSLGEPLSMYQKVIEQKTKRFYHPDYVFVGQMVTSNYWVNKDRKFTNGRQCTLKIIDWNESVYKDLPVDDNGVVDLDALEGV